MGQKVHPVAFRIPYIKPWKSTGYFHKNADYAKHLTIDGNVRTFIVKKFRDIPLGQIFIQYHPAHAQVVIYTSKVARIVGSDGQNLDSLEKELTRQFGMIFRVDVRDVKKPDLSGPIVAYTIARQIEKRLPYRRVIKQAIQRAREKGCLGIKVAIGGRLNGAEIARRETYKEGNIPLMTIRSDIEYITERANTIYGVIGIKVWMYKGEILKKGSNIDTSA
jgi:small subunit ribosomal protein S3